MSYIYESTYALKWFRVEGGHLKGGTMQRFSFRKGRWNWLEGLTDDNWRYTVPPKPLRLCQTGFHVVADLNVSAHCPRAGFDGNNYELWLVDTRMQGPGDNTKRVVGGVKPIARICTNQEWLDARRDRAVNWMRAAGIAHELRDKIGFTPNGNRLAEFLTAEGERQLLVQMFQDRFPSYGKGTHNNARKQLGIRWY